MAERSSLKLIIEKGPREGETLKYSPGSLVKVGRVVRGNTIAIKDAGISSKHVCIQFDNELSKWTLCDLHSSNGTILNGQILKPYVPFALHDGDCIKIGELTSIVVKIEVESATPPRRNPRRKAKAGAGSGPVAVVEKRMTELELGFDGNLGRNKAVERRNLRSRGNKAVDLKNEVDVLSSRRILRSSKKEEVSFIPELKQIPESSPTLQPFEDPDLDERKPADSVVPNDGKRTRGRRKRLQVEPLKENLNNATQVDEGSEATFDKLGETLETNNESAQEHVVEKLVSPQKDSEEKEVMVDESSLKGKGVAEESDCRDDGCEGTVKDTGFDSGQWQDLEKMTLLDFFCYMEVQLPKEIYEKSEKIIADLKEKARRCHEFRLQMNANGNGKPDTE